MWQRKPQCLESNSESYQKWKTATWNYLDLGTILSWIKCIFFQVFFYIIFYLIIKYPLLEVRLPAVTLQYYVRWRLFSSTRVLDCIMAQSRRIHKHFTVMNWRFLKKKPILKIKLNRQSNFEMFSTVCTSRISCTYGIGWRTI